ncbi:MAG: molecular chaperone DnaJ [Thiocapsa sp.]|jgi:curved DNA-binding protein CbpA|nr:molecular chaperone DnaJ [Thiocapsa sp.]MCG6895510.1 molecular chaperone DnaJ [Thiocapsa sp.]
MNDPYLILGVSSGAEDDAIESAYLAAIRRSPPERDPVRFEALRGAYEKIRTHRDRLAHALFDQTPPSAADVLGRAAPLGEPRRPEQRTLAALLRGES